MIDRTSDSHMLLSKRFFLPNVTTPKAAINRNYICETLNIAFVIAFILMVSLTLWFNLTNQYTKWGTGDGKYADPVDSFSEHIIRNTVLNNLIGKENTGGSLIITKGYPEDDYNYYPDGTTKYHSNRGLQALVYEQIARLNAASFVENSRFIFKHFGSLIAFCLLSAFQHSLLVSLEETSLPSLRYHS